MKSSRNSTSRLREELADLWEENRHYLLSHHEESQLYRCYSTRLLGRDLNFCARCTGIYPGIALGLTGSIVYVMPSQIVVALSAAPTIAEKYLTGVKGYRGWNSLRTLTGVLLGYGYVNGLLMLIQNPLNVFLLTAGVIYGVAALLLIYLEEKK